MSRALVIAGSLAAAVWFGYHVGRFAESVEHLPVGSFEEMLEEFGDAGAWGVVR